MTKKNAMIENMIATRDALHAQKPLPPVSQEEFDRTEYSVGNRRHAALREVAHRARTAEAAKDAATTEAKRKMFDQDGNVIPALPDVPAAK